MKHKLLLAILFLVFRYGSAQTKIIGRVADVTGKPLAYANIMLQNSYDGAVTDSLGQFLFMLKEPRDSITLETRLVGYITARQKISKAQFPIPVLFVLHKEVIVLDEVVVVAGNFETGDKKQASTVLNTLDVLTTAGANADLMAAIRTLPGAQKVGNQTGLFVRGGSGSETKQFIDGALVSNPFFPSLPDVGQRARFSPYLFKGIVFNTGAYSALYGEALSSIVALESIDLPEKSENKISVSTAFVEMGMQHLTPTKKAAYGLTYNYTNIGPYFSVIKQRLDYHIAPEVHNVEGYGRIKTKYGIIKFYSMYSHSDGGFRRSSIDSVSLKNEFSNKNKYWYNNAIWKENLSNHWKITTSLGYSLSKNDFRQLLVNSTNEPITTGISRLDSVSLRHVSGDQQLIQSKLVLEKIIGHNALRFGGEWWHQNESANRITNAAQLNDQLTSGFAETDINFTQKIAGRVGARFEYSSLLNQSVIMPRLALAYKTGETSQASMAYGIFYQKPENEYLFQAPHLRFIRADHYLLNFQKMTALQTLRIEVFYKNYQHLIKTFPAYTNEGSGYAQGIELFWRDKKTLKHIDYWISYSFLDTKREALNFPYRMRPTYAATHTVNWVEKFFIPHIKSGFSITNSFMYGVPYYLLRPAPSSWQVAEQGVVPSNHTMDISVYYLPFFAKKTKRPMSVVVFASVSNVFNKNVIYGYNFSYDGKNKEPILPTANNFFFLGLFINVGADRSNDVIDGRLNN